MNTFRLFNDLNGESICINLATVTKVKPYLSGKLCMVYFVDGAGEYIDLPFKDMCNLLNNKG